MATPTEPPVPPGVDAGRFARAIAAIDQKLSDQLNAIMHDPKFLKLEGSWRGLNYLIMNSETGTSLKIRVLNVSKRDLTRDLQRAVEFDQSQLFKKIYENEFGTPGGEPYGALIGDYEWTQHPDDVDTLRLVSNVAAGAFAPFISAAGPGMFGFGAGVAAERESGQLELKRASPMPNGAYVAGKLAAGMALSALALLPIYAVALAVGVSMPAWRWAAVLALGSASAAPFGLIGLNLGLRLSAQGAVAAANLLFMAFGMLGGLWIPLSQLPPWMTRLAWMLPSFHLGQLSLGLAGVLPPTDVAAHLGILLGVCIIAVVGAWSAWRREEA